MTTRHLIVVMRRCTNRVGFPVPGIQSEQKIDDGPQLSGPPVGDRLYRVRPCGECRQFILIEGANPVRVEEFPLAVE